jgi:acetyl esterase/lipase
MKRWLAVVLVVSCCGFLVHAQDHAGTQYDLLKDIAYRGETNLDAYSSARCRVDLYVPRGQTNFPTVVWFHGGGLTEGNRFIPAALKTNGIAIAAAGYRLSPKVKAPAYIEDAAAAVAWTFGNIARYGGATNLIFVSGHSAGAYLAAMIGLDKQWLGRVGVDANNIAGLIPLSPQAITHFTVRAERGISDKQPVLDAFAPVYHVRRDAPPMLIMTGDREKEMLGRYEENAYFWRMMTLVGHKETELRELRGFTHGNMPDPAYPMLLEFIRSRTGLPPTR